MSEEDETADLAGGERSSARARMKALRLVAEGESQEASLAPGDLVGHYKVVEQLAAGGMGVLFRAHDERLDRDVALKVVSSEWARSFEIDQGRARLLREAQAMASLRHPNVIMVYDVAELGDKLVVAMELFEAKPLKAWLEDRGPSPSELVEMIRSAAAGLQAAHARGLVHRDVKPDNILVNDAGEVRVIDFGLARGGSSLRRGPSSLLSTRVTLAGLQLGTLPYVAPELAEGEPSAASDQYALAATLYECLFGQAPSGQRELSSVPKHAAKGGVVSRRTRLALARALDAEPARRFASVAEFSAALSSTRRVSTKWLPWIGLAAGLSLVAAMSLGYLLAPSADPCDEERTRVQSIWGTETRAQAREAFGRSFGGSEAQAFTQLDKKMSAAVDALARARAAACSERVQGPVYAEHAQRRESCLLDLEDQLSSLAGQYADASPSTVAHARASLSDLGDPADCERDEFLSRVELLPQEPEARRAIRQLQKALSQADAARRSGRLDEAQSALRAVQHEVNQDLGPGLRARYQQLQGQIFSDRGRRQDAEAAFREGLANAELADNDRRRASLWIELAAELGLGQTRFEASREALSAADLVFTKGDFEDLEARARLVEAEVLVAEHRLAEAEGPLRRLLFEPSGVDLSRVKIGLSRVAESRNWHTTTAWVREALEDSMREFGPRHPRVARIRIMLARRYRESGLTDKAEAQLQQALDDARALERAHALEADILGSLGGLYLLQGRFEESRKTLEESIGVAERSPDRVDFDLASNYASLGAAYSHLGEPVIARHAFERARNLIESSVGRRHGRMLLPMLNEASAEERMGEFRRAATRYSEAGELGRELRAGNPELYFLLAARNEILAGRFDEARAMLESVEQGRRADWSTEFAAALRAEAGVLERPSRAKLKALAKACEFEANSKYHESFVLRCELAMSKAYKSFGQRERAELHLERAIEAASRGDADDRRLGEKLRQASATK